MKVHHARLTPMQALLGIHLVEGRPVLAADTLVAIVRRSPVCAMWRTVESTEARCTIETQRKGADDVAIIRVEQLYPFPHKAFSAEMKRYPNATEIVWCQDEPQNQGAWFFIQHNIHENMLEGQKLGYSGRAASASPAVGYSHLHQEQQKALVDGAFAKLKGFVLTK